MVGAQQRKAILAYLQWLQPVLNLNEWTIRLADQTADEGNAAEIQTIDDSRVATVFLSADFDTYARPDVRRYLIHELLHLHHQEAEQVVTELKATLAPGEHRLVAALHRHACEVMVDQLANAIAPLIEVDPTDQRHLERICPD